MYEILGNLDGVAVYQDDVIIYGKTDEEHDVRLSKVIQVIKESGLKT